MYGVGTPKGADQHVVSKGGSLRHAHVSTLGNFTGATRVLKQSYSYAPFGILDVSFPAAGWWALPHRSWHGCTTFVLKRSVVGRCLSGCSRCRVGSLGGVERGTIAPSAGRWIMGTVTRVSGWGGRRCYLNLFPCHQTGS